MSVTTDPVKTGIVSPNPLRLSSIDTPATDPNGAYFYSKRVGSRDEAHWKDNLGSEVQITSAGSLAISLANCWDITGNALSTTGVLGATNGFTVQLWAGSSRRATLPSTGGMVVSTSRGTLISGEQFLVHANANGFIYQTVANYNLSTRNLGRAGMSFYCYNAGFSYIYQTSDTFTLDGYKDARNFIVDTGSNHLKLITTGASAPISLYTGSTERLQFDPDGYLGLWGTTPTVGQASAYTQTYATADKTLGAYTPDDESGAYTGIDNAQGGTPYAQLTDLNALRTAYENLRAFVEDGIQMLNSIVDDMQAWGAFA
jgi:hypothetical protein